MGGSDLSLPQPLPGKSSQVKHPLLDQDRLFPATAQCHVSGWNCLLCLAKEQSFQSFRGGNMLSYDNPACPVARLSLKRYKPQPCGTFCYLGP